MLKTYKIGWTVLRGVPIYTFAMRTHTSATCLTELRLAMTRMRDLYTLLAILAALGCSQKLERLSSQDSLKLQRLIGRSLDRGSPPHSLTMCYTITIRKRGTKGFSESRLKSFSTGFMAN